MSTVINGANFKRVHVTTASVTMDPDTEYTMSYAGDNEFLLPAVAPIGSVITIVNDTDGSLDITQNAGQAIHNLGTSTTRGVTGGISSGESDYTVISFKCVIANTDFAVLYTNGSFIFT